MDQRPRPREESTISCEVCLKEIPRSEAVSDEASEYVRYFCSLECYDKWRHSTDAQSPRDESS